MRITSGSAKGRKLYIPKGRDIRPTSDKMRQAIFNMLLSYGLPVDAHVLDGFCGTGALGLEALSRGAESCVFVDRDIHVVRDNIDALGLEENSSVLRKDVTKIGDRPETTPHADLVFLDPPYDKGFLDMALPALLAGQWLADEALIVAESEKNWHFTDSRSFKALDSRVYGACRVTFIGYQG